jgi:spore germination protein GerM
MKPRTGVVAAVCIGVAAAITWVLFTALPRWSAQPASPLTDAPAPPAPQAAGRKIKAQLLFVSEDGTRLRSVEQDVPYAELPIDQAREILNAQMAPPAPPLVSAIPAGTSLRALFITPQGQAFVDLSPEVAGGHPGGSVSELLTIYTVVHALTLNLPAVTSVQLLVDGKEVDTLAGHVDLRRPLAKSGDLTVDAN